MFVEHIIQRAFGCVFITYCVCVEQEGDAHVGRLRLDVRLSENVDRASLEALDGVVLSYTVDWPLNIVIDSQALRCYSQVCAHAWITRDGDRKGRSLRHSRKHPLFFPV